MEQNNTKNSRIIREKNQISENDKTNMENDIIQPTQLYYEWIGEMGEHELNVLGTFTSKSALGLFLVNKMINTEKNNYRENGLLDNLHLRKIMINPEYDIEKNKYNQ